MMKIAVLVLLVAFANAEGDVMKDMPMERRDIPVPPGFGHFEMKAIPVAPIHVIPEAISPGAYVNKPLFQLKTSETPVYTKPVEPIVEHSVIPSGVRVLDTTHTTYPYFDSLRSALFGGYYPSEAGYYGYNGQYYMGGKPIASPLTRYFVDKTPFNPYYYAPSAYAQQYAPSAYAQKYAHALPVADYRYSVPMEMKSEVTGMGGQFYGTIPLLKGAFYGEHETLPVGSYNYMPMPITNQYAPYYYYNKK